MAHRARAEEAKHGEPVRSVDDDPDTPETPLARLQAEEQHEARRNAYKHSGNSVTLGRGQQLERRWRKSDYRPRDRLALRDHLREPCQVRHLDAKGSGDAPNGPPGRIPPCLDVAEPGRVQVSAMGHLLLREPASGPCLANGLAERNLRL